VKSISDVRQGIVDSRHPIFEATSQRGALGQVHRLRGNSEITRLSGIAREMIELILPSWLEVTHQLPLGCPHHSHLSCLIVVHVVLAEKYVVQFT
jgi:hypothetical protein